MRKCTADPLDGAGGARRGGNWRKNPAATEFGVAPLAHRSGRCLGNLGTFDVRWPGRTRRPIVREPLERLFMSTGVQVGIGGHDCPELLGVPEHAPTQRAELKFRVGRLKGLGDGDELIDCAHDHANIGNSTVRVNGHLTVRCSGRERSSYRSMLADVVARVEKRLAATKQTPAGASKAAGLSVDAIRNMQRAARDPENRQGVTTRTIEALAPILKTTVSWLINEEGEEAPGLAAAARPETAAGDPVSLDDLRAHIARIQSRPASTAARGKSVERRIPVVGEVAAGVWKETAIRELDNIEDWLALEVEGYERAQLRAWKLVGPSMNLIYPSGRFVVTAHPIEAGLRIGDYVVAQRQQGILSEITLKEFVVDEAGRMALWPRSSDPAFQEPIYLKGGDELDQTAPIIIGVVVADYSKRNRPAAVFGRPPTWAE